MYDRLEDTPLYKEIIRLASEKAHQEGFQEGLREELQEGASHSTNSSIQLLRPRSQLKRFCKWLTASVSSMVLQKCQYAAPIFFQKSISQIAAMAQKSTNFPCRMVMINTERAHGS